MCEHSFEKYSTILNCVFSSEVWCGMSIWPILLLKLILLFLWLPYGSIKPKILGLNFSRPSTSFYGTFKMAAIEITYLTITWVLAQLVTILMSIPIFLGMRNIIVPILNVYVL